jgi:RNA polymerase sigma-70 factor (ECF subfamily)
MTEIPETHQSPEGDPEESLEQVELTDHIWQALSQIEEKYRALIVLKHFQNCSYEQIAQIMDVPVKTIKSRLYSARQQLGRELVKKGIRKNG